MFTIRVNERKLGRYNTKVSVIWFTNFVFYWKIKSLSDRRKFKINSDN